MLSLTPLQAMLLAQDTYGGLFGSSDITRFAKKEQTIVKDHTNMCVYKMDGGKYILSFQGSRGLGDWLDNLFAFLLPRRSKHASGALIHAGFSINYEPVADIVNELVKSYGIQNVEFVGHSLGAAHARRARFEMKLKYNYEVPIILFGEPNGGNKDYYDFCGETDALSFQNNDDIVANIPWPFLGFYRPKKIKISDGPKDWSGIKTKLLAWAGNCNSHYPQRYVNAVIKYEQEIK